MRKNPSSGAESDSVAARELLLYAQNNPLRKSKPEWYYDAGMRSYILDLGGSVYILSPTGSGFKYSLSVGGEILHYSKTYPEIEQAMDAIDHGQGKKFKRPSGIYGSTRNNPGAEWHGMKELEADQMDRHAKKKSQKDFFHGKSVAHLESGLAARAMKMNPTKWEPPGPLVTVAESESTGTQYILSSDGNVYARTLSGWVNHGTLQEFSDHALKHWRKLRWIKKNPLAVFGFANPNRRRRPSPVRRYRGARKNPLKQFTAGIAGVVYSRCWEVRAEKTSLSAERAGFKRGLYKHPFKRSSKVEVLALDNGDLLLHSTVGVKLW